MRNKGAHRPSLALIRHFRRYACTRRQDAQPIAEPFQRRSDTRAASVLLEGCASIVSVRVGGEKVRRGALFLAALHVD